MTTTTRPTVCHACGSALPVPPTTGAAGYALMCPDGSEDPTVPVCYGCADADHRLSIARAPIGGKTTGYMQARTLDGGAVDPRSRIVTTCTGGVLLSILSVSQARGIDGRLSVHHVRAVAPDGSVWYGAGPGYGCALTLRKTQQTATFCGRVAPAEQESEEA